MVELATGSFAEVLKHHRAVAGLTQEELAERANLSARAISDLERGIKQRPYPHTVQRLILALDLSEEEGSRFQRAARRPGSGEEPATPVQTGRRAISLPIQPTSFIGRWQEVEEVSSRLRRDDVRLLTLTGTGGVGKTRLALRSAEEVADCFPDGVVFVSLAALVDPNLVLGAIATVLGIKELGGEPILERLIGYLWEKRLLLLLDNFEHLLSAVEMVSRILASCEGPKILVTSRATLQISAEHEYPVVPLAVPTPQHLPEVDVLSRFDAIQLFVQRAEAVTPGFTMTEGNAPPIAEICFRLDGLPLAIELAAARIRLFPPQALLARLSDRLHLLTGGPKDVPARQQTLRNTIDWSYSLLSPEEQALFARLSVFAGGCTFEAAETVCNPDKEFDSLETMASLVDRSLIRQEGDEEPRFVMLETIREYAAERLDLRGEGAAIRSRHAMYYLSLVEAAGSQISGAGEAHWLHRLEDEHDNWRTALRWAVDHVEGEMALRFVGGLGRFWLRRGYVHEGLGWVRRALDINKDRPSALEVEAIVLAADMLGWLNDYEAVIELIEKALPTYRQLGDQRAVCRLLVQLHAKAGIGDLAGAIHAVEESVNIARGLASPLDLARVLQTLGPLVRLQGDTDRAVALFREAEKISRQHGFRGELAVQLEALGDIAIERGQYDAARACFVEGLQINRERQAQMRMTSLLYGFAALAVAQHAEERAACLFAAEETSWGRLGQPLDGLFVTDRGVLVARARSKTSEEAWVRSRERGKAMSLEEAVAYALEGSGEIVGPDSPGIVIPPIGIACGQLQHPRTQSGGPVGEGPHGSKTASCAR